MDAKLLDELIRDTQMKDIPDRYRGIVEITGVQKFAELSAYARGDELYFPKVENIVSAARNRRIKKEYRSGEPVTKLADRYNLTTKQIWNILKDEPVTGQISLDEWMNAGS